MAATRLDITFLVLAWLSIALGTSNETMSDWRTSILGGLSQVSRKGTPGTMIVHGPTADAILTNKDAQVVIGAATYGSGRVVIFTSDQYTKLFLRKQRSDEKLVDNIKSWVTNGSYVHDGEIKNVDKYRNFDDIPSSCKILVWVGTKSKSTEFYGSLMTWISNGGGFVGGKLPWYYTHYQNKILQTMPLTVVLNSVGIRYTGTYLKGSGPLLISENVAHAASLPNAIKVCQRKASNLKKYGTNIEGAIDNLSLDELEDFLPDIEDMIKKYKPKKHCVPTKTKPVRYIGKNLAAVINRIFVRTGQFNGRSVAEGIDKFPGDFDTPPILTNGTGSASSNGHPSKVFPMGYYLPAGQEATISWTNQPSEGWRILVGAHKDNLYSNTASWRRWPVIRISRGLFESPLKIKSPFGGGIYLKSPPNVRENITINMEGVVPSPKFILGDENWESQRKNAGLWADIVGEKMMITLPASSIRDLEDPTEVMLTWDKVVDSQYDLRGKDPFKGQGQWIVTDEQPKLGAMHSGYPIVTKMDIAYPRKDGKNALLLDNEYLTTAGSWGIFHEIGHNMQDLAWTWSGTREVTCNVFTLYTLEMITGKKPWPRLKRHYSVMERYLQKGANYSDWKSNAGVALGIYAQLARDFGWDTYKAVFREYNKLRQRPKNDNERVNQWIKRFSKHAQKNLCPVFEFWGLPVKKHVMDSLKHLDAFLHSDESSKEWAPARAAEIREKYGIKARLADY